MNTDVGRKGRVAGKPRYYPHQVCIRHRAVQCAPVAARPSPHALDVVPFVSAVGFEKGSAWERGSAVTLQLVMEMGMRRLGGGGSSQP